MNDDATEPRGRVLNSTTLVPLGAVGTLLVVLFSAYLWLDGQLRALQGQIQQQGVMIERRLSAVELAVADRWTVTDQRIWSYRLERENAGRVKVPEPSAAQAVPR